MHRDGEILDRNVKEESFFSQKEGKFSPDRDTEDVGSFMSSSLLHGQLGPGVLQYV